jgi:hypothetical protein
MGLAEDLGFLVRGFIQDPPAGAAAKASPTPPAEERDDIQIALHGLTLDQGEEARLRHLVREMIRERAADSEAGQ